MKRKKPKKNKGKFNILALDPSLTGFGYAVLSGEVILTCGCIKTQSNSKKLRIRKGDDRMDRVHTIATRLKEVIKKHKIKYIVSELPHGSQSAVAAIALGLVSGMVQGMADFLDIGLEWYSEGDAKKAALGKSSAMKEEMIIKMSEIYGSAWKTGTKYKDEAVADSLAIHHVALLNSSALKLLNS